MRIEKTKGARHRSGLTLLVALVVLAAGLVAGCSSDESATTTAEATTTTEGATTTAPPPTTTTTTTAPPAGTPVVIDTDLSLDGIMAILYLLGRPELDVQAITVSGPGEAHCEPGVQIAAGLVALAGAGDVAVACGPEEPLEGANAFPAALRAAADDAWGLELPEGDPPSDLPAPELLVSLISASAEPVVLFTDGTLTNLAVALRLDPGIVGNIAMVYTMGGAVDVPGNTFDNPEAEFNIWVDPTAAAEVFASGVPLTLVPLDATNQVPVHLFQLAALREHQTTPAATATVTMLDASEELTAGTLYYWDGITAALLVDESLAQFETMRLAVVHEGGPEVVGKTERAADGSEVRVALTVDADRFIQQFFSGLAGEDIGPIAAPPQTPAATIEELLTAYYAGGGGAGGWDAFRALSTYECRHTFYLVDGQVGQVAADFAHADYDFGSDPIQGLEVLGAPLVSGDVVAVPVRYTYPDPTGVITGFDVMVVKHVEGGMLISGVATFVATPGADAEAAVVQPLLEAEAAAWNADDIDGLLATWTDDAVFWQGVGGGYATFTGAALREVIPGLFWVSVEITGTPLLSGPFAAVPNRLTVEASGRGSDGISIYWVRDGKLALHAFGQGE